jgi:DNA-binding transcriptional MerR regulator
VESSGRTALTIDELAAVSGTTTRRIRSFQTLELLPHPELRGRTGLYGPDHLTRLSAILRLQDLGFSLESLGVLFRALRSGETLAAVLGLPEPAAENSDPGAEVGADTAELYGFAELQPATTAARRGRVRPLLSVVPTTVWDESEAS